MTKHEKDKSKPIMYTDQDHALYQGLRMKTDAALLDYADMYRGMGGYELVEVLAERLRDKLAENKYK